MFISSLIKYGARLGMMRTVMPRLTMAPWGLRRFVASPPAPGKDAKEHVTAMVMDTLKRMDKCDLSKLGPAATFEELGKTLAARKSRTGLAGSGGGGVRD